VKLSEAGHTSNIEYWKAVARRYQTQRDMALQQVKFMQEKMLADWVRDSSRIPALQHSETAL